MRATAHLHETSLARHRSEPRRQRASLYRWQRPLVRRTGGARWVSHLIAAGVAVLAVGAAADLAYHTLPATTAVLGPLTGADGGRAHLITLVGMVMTLGGILLRGVRR